ncbi:MAG: dTDP-4-dehydrorhamnose 3,5-epimerase [Deferribacterales bacterium]
MKIIKTKIPDVVLLEPKVFGDHRGFFMESYSKKTMESLGLKYELIQDNHSLSAQAFTMRGLHYQKNPDAQTKIVRVLAGAILDVVVDIRKGSPTYGQHVSVILTAENKRQIIVPKGFAHGVLTLVPDTEIMYKVDAFYSPECDRGIRWNDPALGIEWPTDTPVLSDKDANSPLLADADNNFVYEG